MGEEESRLGREAGREGTERMIGATQRFSLGTLLALNILIVFFIVPAVLIVSEASSAQDVSFLEGMSIAVAPFVDLTGYAGSQRKIGGILRDELDSLGVMKVVPGRRIDMVLKRLGFGPGDYLSLEDIVRLGRALQVDMVVSGTLNNLLMIDSKTSVVSMSISVISAHTGRILWSGSVARTFHSVGDEKESLRKAARIIVKMMCENLEKNSKKLLEDFSTPLPRPEIPAVADKAAGTSTGSDYGRYSTLGFEGERTRKRPARPATTSLGRSLAERQPSPGTRGGGKEYVESFIPDIRTSGSAVEAARKEWSGAGRIELGVLHFPAGSSKPAGEDVEGILGKISSELAQYPSSPVLVEGYTDDTARESSHARLSLERCRTVMRLLAARGVSPSRFILVGYGSGKPVADNATEKGRRQNRRVVVSYFPGARLFQFDGAVASVGKRRSGRKSSVSRRSKHGTSRAVKKAPKQHSSGRPRHGTSRRTSPTVPASEHAAAAGYSPATSAKQPAGSTERPDSTRRRLSRAIEEILEDYYKRRRRESGGERADAAGTIYDDAAVEALIERTERLSRNRDNALVLPGNAYAIKVSGHEELSRKVVIGEDGILSFPLVEDLKVLGLPESKLGAILGSKLHKYILNAQVTVKKLHYVNFLGDVGTRGRIEFYYPPTILEALAKADGVKDLSAQYDTMRLLLTTNEGTRYDLDLTSLLKSPDAARIRLFHGDTVNVYPDRSDKIYVIGAIHNAVVYRKGIRLLDALIEAGGVDDEKKMNIKNIRILRKKKDGTVERTIVNLHDLIHRGDPSVNVALKPGDYVIVPRRSKRTTFFSVFREFIAPFANTTLVIKNL